MEKPEYKDPTDVKKPGIPRKKPLRYSIRFYERHGMRWGWELRGSETHVQNEGKKRL